MHDWTVPPSSPKWVLRRGGLLAECGLLHEADESIKDALHWIRLLPQEKQLQLGKKEYDIMRVLMANKGLVISKETLLLKVWGEGSEAVENNVETYISFLRKKLHFLKVHVWIVTIRGLGYRLTEREETA